MQVCGEHGLSSKDEIAYSSYNCPACAEIEELKEEYETKISELEDKLSELED